MTSARWILLPRSWFVHQIFQVRQHMRRGWLIGPLLGRCTRPAVFVDPSPLKNTLSHEYSERAGRIGCGRSTGATSFTWRDK